MLCLDNAAAHRSEEFMEWCRKLNIKLQFSPPYSPQSNGYAERCVKTVKVSLKKQLLEARNQKVSLKIKKALLEFLFEYRNTPHKTTGKCPAELVLKKKPRTVLSNVNPLFNFKNSVKVKFVKRYYNDGDKVYLKNNEGTWDKAFVLYRCSEVVYKVKMKSGHTRKAHVDQLKDRMDQQQHTELQEDKKERRREDNIVGLKGVDHQRPVRLRKEPQRLDL
jgi:hypothetical protein